jgi:Flp pilus assembly protein TadG
MMALELLILIPLIVVLLLLIVGLGRAVRGRQLVEAAAAAAARASSLSTSPTQATLAAQQIAADTVRQGDLSCHHLAVSTDVAAFRPGGQVSVTMRCTASLSSLAMSGLPYDVTFTATSTSPLETYRSFTDTP